MGWTSGDAAHAPAPAERGDRRVRLGVLGCGAVTERLHLPAVRHVDALEIAVLVDRDANRARTLGSRFGVADVRQSFDDISGDDVDAVLIALPNRMHAPVAIEFVERGIAVLVEKPMALGAADARTMIRAASEAGVTLQVGLMKRFARAATFIRAAIEYRLLGPITGFSVQWGPSFRWPLTTDSGLNPALAGGGVLTDFGSHFLDLLCWWFGEPTLLAYADDCRGGVEADCELSLTMSGAAGEVSGIARFSRIRELRNVVRITGENLTIEWNHEAPDDVRVMPTQWSGAPPPLRYETAHAQSFRDLFVAQLRSFAAAVATGAPAGVPGETVLPSVALIEQCYRERKRREEPWERAVFVPDPATADRRRQSRSSSVEGTGREERRAYR